MSTVLNVTDLCKTYTIDKRQNNVLINVNLKIEEGEMVAIMGPSGSGKSTLLYTVSGMDKLTAGKVEFLGKEISKLSENELAELRLEEMGFVFQQMYMLKNLSILDNIVLPGFESNKNKNNKNYKKEVMAKGENLMRKLGIIDIAGNDINEVSGGQLQRAAIARAMINNPKIIFADEPTGALSRSGSNDVLNELVKINQEGTTIMLVTHDVKVAAKCSRVLYILDGNIKGEQVLGTYQNETELRDRERKLSNWLVELGW